VYRIREFAALAGVTVRALHHYDRLGLLKPSGRSRGGYRLYRDSDLVAWNRSSYQNDGAAYR
jgi:DNA-binding transcriptional MerR regulator